MDNGSSIDILYYLVFQQIRINKERLPLSNMPFVRFDSTKVFPVESIVLLVTIGTYP